MSRDRKYPLRLPAKDAEAVDRVCEQSGVSFNQVVVVCVRNGLPDVRESLSPTGRITNVDPLPKKVLERIYSRRTEEDEEGLQRFMKAQAFGGED